MNPKSPSPCRCLIVSLLLATGLVAQTDVDAQVAAIWRDATFQKQFVGGYGIDPDVEPRVTKDEVKLLERVLPLMGTEPERAQTMLVDAMQPDCSAILDYTLGSLRFQANDLAAALANMRTAVAKFPSFRRAWRNLGLIAVRSADYDEAVRAMTRTIELGGADAYAYGPLGYAYMARQDFQPAESAFRSALLLQPDNTTWRLGLAQCVLRQQKYEDAASLLDVLVVRYPDKADFWWLQAQAFLAMKQPLQAASNLAMLDMLGKASVTSSNQLGDIYASEGLADLAVVAYERAIDLDPQQSVDGALRAAENLAHRREPELASRLAAHVRRTIGDRLVDADRRRLLKVEARYRVVAGDDSAEIVSLLEELVRLDPLDGDALLLLGRHFAQAGDTERARMWFQRAAAVESCEAEARIREAQVLVGLRRFEEALPLLRRAQQIRPSDEVARYLEQVERGARARR